MSCILLPVDFSSACHNAYRYGLHLAKHMGLDVVLVHYYSGSIDPRGTFYIGGDGSIQGSFEDRLRQFAYSTGEMEGFTAIEPPCRVNIHYETDVSLTPAAAIAKRAGKSDIKMIVMAPRSSSSVLGKWLGSTTTTVSESCDRPIMIVPPGAHFKPLKEVVVANNGKTVDTFPLSYLDEFSVLQQARLHFVFVEPNNNGTNENVQPWIPAKDRSGSESHGADGYIVNTVHQKDISHGLMDYAGKVDADLIVAVNHTRPLWRAFFRISLTQDLALRSRLPILVLHADARDAADNRAHQAAKEKI